MLRRSPARKRPTLEKYRTGIAGFDWMTSGGLPRGRATLVVGGPGSGKTVLALQALVNAARRGGRSIFVTFEETAANIVANHAGFAWELARLAGRFIHILEARLPADAVTNGEFDLQALLAGVDALIRRTGAAMVVFDAVDVLVGRLADGLIARRELGRLHDWILRFEGSAIMTAKTGPLGSALQTEFMSFMADCIVALNHRLTDRTSPRGIQVIKYRGSRHAHAEMPLLLTSDGVVVRGEPSETLDYPVSRRRISTGIDRLDTMLGGGYYRGSSILVSGAPGTAKTTLAGALAASACQKGRRTLYLSFDEAPEQVVRDLQSVGIDLATHRATGKLSLHGLRVGTSTIEEHCQRIMRMIDEFKPRKIVIDSISALIRMDDREAADRIVIPLIGAAKATGATILCTSLVEPAVAQESTLANISTIVDTWIHLSYSVRGGERNRALTVVKSRGTSHSNQVRELVLSRAGVTLADVYELDGEILMGSARVAREAAEAQADARAAGEHTERRRRLEQSIADVRQRISLLETELQAKSAEVTLLEANEQGRQYSAARQRAELARRRFADSPAGPIVARRRSGRGHNER